ncbi:MAG: hypothetical protein HZB37_11980 [Planctomycetes bacterium]|nr:hypothetical protein [Planctomycetota bacterium]
MEKYFAIVSASLIIIATAGFLLIKQIHENKIKRICENNNDLINDLGKISQFMAKANSYRELAIVTSDTIEILKALNVPNEIIQKSVEMNLAYYKFSASSVVNALSKQFNDNQGEHLIKTIDTLKTDELKDFYRNYMEKAANTTFTLWKNIDENKKKINDLEGNKNLFWYICFACQSFGMIFGLAAIFYKKS